jgi:putative DNA primase/helicase
MRNKKIADGGRPSAGNVGSSLNGSMPHSTTNGHTDQTPMSKADQAAQLAAAAVRSHDELEAERALLTQGLHDEGNAQCLKLRYPGKFAQNDAFGWLAYDGTHWTRQGAESRLDRAIVETLSARIQAALDSGQADKHGPLIKFCAPSSGRIQGAKYNFRSLVETPESTFDNDPDLLNCSNGVIDLRTGTLTTHAPGQRFMHCVGIPYNPKADFSQWVAWLTNAVKDRQIVDWLQMAVGYSLTGHTREEVLFYLYGPPRSGKGTFTEALLTLLGSPLAEVVTFSTLTSTTEADTQNFNLAPLHSSRLIVASESNQYERFNEAKVKQLTGGDKIQCAFKHKTPFSYRPKYKLWLASNQPVNADPDDDAVWGRVRVIAFPESHLGREDKLLKDTMRTPAILQGVLAWAVQGAINWYKLGGAGLPELDSSIKIKNAQRAELDNVQAWIDECCKRGEFTGSSALYSSYQNWCKDNGVTAKRQKGLTQALQRKGYGYAIKKLNGKTIRVVTGIEIIKE